MGNAIPEIRQQIQDRLRELDRERDQLLQMLALMQNDNGMVSSTRVNLTDLLKQLLEGSKEPERLSNLLRKAKAAGYIFKGKNPNMSVYSALSRHPEMFERTKTGWQLSKKYKQNS